MSNGCADSWETPRFPIPSCEARQWKRGRFGKTESGWVFTRKCRAQVKNFPGGSDSEDSVCNAGDWVWSLGWEDPLEKGMETHSSILAWRILWTGEPGRLQPMGSWRVRHDWVTNTSTFFSIANGDAAQPSFSALLECCQPGLYLQIEEDQKIFQKETREARKKQW